MGGDSSKLLSYSQSVSGGRLLVLSTFAEEIQSVPFEAIERVYSAFIGQYGRTKLLMTREEFRASFRGILSEDPANYRVFDPWEKGVVNVLDVFAGSCILCANDGKNVSPPLADRLDWLLSLYDLVDAGCFNECEMEIMVESVIRGACEAAQVNFALGDDCRRLVQRYFVCEVIVGPEEEKETQIYALREWIDTQPNILQFLQAFANCRFLHRSVKVMEAEISRVSEELFAAAYGDVLLKHMKVPIDKTLQLFRNIKGHPLREDDIPALTQLLSGNGEGEDSEAAPLADVLGVLRCAVCFSVVDDAGTGAVPFTEMSALMWFMSRVEEESQREETREAIEALRGDKTSKTSVTCLEWINFNVAVDKGTGKVQSTSEAKALFRTYDADGTGSLDVDEIRKMISDGVNRSIEQLKACGRRVPPAFQPLLDTMVSECGTDLLNAMDSDGGGSVEWVEFKECYTLLYEMTTNLHKFIFAVGEDAPSSTVSTHSKKRSKVI